MKLNILYENEKYRVDIPDRNVLKVVYPKERRTGSPFHLIRESLRNPQGGVTFQRFLQYRRELLIVVNDHTRPTPTAEVLDVIYGYIKGKNFRFIVATGNHERPGVHHLKLIFGRYYERFMKKIIIHNSKAGLYYLGRSRNNTELWINSRIMQVEGIITISSIEPHYFAGYTGGRKSFLPGCAGYKTIEQNHSQALHPGAAIFNLKDNPVHQDMVDMVNRVGTERIFSIQLLLENNYNIYKVFSGHIHKSFNAALPYARRYFYHRLKRKAEIVVAVTRPPYDINLYQTLKSIENARRVLKRGGILLVVSSCYQGFGPESFARFFKNPELIRKIAKSVSGHYRLGDHNAVNLRSLRDFARVWFVSRLNSDILRRAGFQNFSSVLKAIDQAMKIKGPNGRMLFLMDASLCVR